MNQIKYKLGAVALIAALVLILILVPGATREEVNAADPTPTETAGSGVTTSPSPTGTTTATTSGPKIVWNSAVEGITSVQVKYKTEEIEVRATKKLYYGIIKKATDTGIKEAELVPASNGGSGDTYIIDISTISASKESYIGITTLTAPGTDGLVPVTSITLVPTERKIVFNPNWSIEGDEAKGNKVLTNVVITNADSTVYTYVHGTPTGSNEKRITELDIQWRKGTNGEWSEMSALTSSKWDSMKMSGAVVYFRVGAKDSSVVTPSTTTTGLETGHRFSKENKIKLNITKASSIKLDVSKLTLAIKNGVQFRVEGKPDWVTILPYSGQSKITDTAIRPITNKTTFDPYTENTQVKVTYMDIADIRAALGTTAPAETEPLVLEVRIAATIKKPASRISTVTIPPQGEAPKASISYDGKSWTVTELTAADTTAPAVFEYTIVKKSDVTEKKLDMSSLKWSSIKAGTSIKDTTKSTYSTIDKSRKTIVITDPDIQMLIRRKGVTASSKTTAVLASKYLALDVPKVASTTPTPTGGAQSGQSTSGSATP